MTSRLALLVAGLLSLLAFAGTAQAANTRVAISDFKWSKNPTIDLGENVTWDWLGPDTMHSVTGQAPNASQWDSDPTNNIPFHFLGASFKVSFDEPGEYLFICKVHSSVRGTVTVTDQPGDPDSDPGRQGPINFDTEPPLVEMVNLDRTVFGPRGKGTSLEFETGERGQADVDFYRLVRKGSGKKKRVVRRYTGFQEWSAHVGMNRVRFAQRTSQFKAKPGRYVAMFRATDEFSNVSEPFKLSFEIKGKAKKRKPRR